VSGRLIAMLSSYYGFQGYIFNGLTVPDQSGLLLVNGFKIQKPKRFKNLAHERAFEIALVLANHKPMWSGVTIMTTSECIDVMMSNGDPEIQLYWDVKNPRKVARDTMELVPSFFEKGKVKVSKRKHGNHMWFLEIV